MTDDRSPEELERDAERIRSGIASTAEELKHRMSPGQMVDEVTRYFRDSDSSVALDNMRRQIRDNPMALALIGTGLAWLMLGGRRSDREVYGYGGYGDDYGSGEFYGAYGSDPARPGAHGAGEGSVGYVAGSNGSGGASGKASELGARARDAAGRASAAVHGYTDKARATGSDYASRAEATGHQASGYAEGVTDRVRRAAHDARDRVSDLGHAAGERARGFAESAGSRWHGVADRGRHWAEDAGHHAYGRGRGLLDAIEREPLVTGAIGLAVGAAIGAMLPKLRVEEEAYAEGRDQIRRGAARAYDYAAERAREVAEDAYAAGREAADREGLTPGDRPIAERVAGVAKAVGGAVADDLEADADRARSAASGAADQAHSAADAGADRVKAAADKAADSAHRATEGARSGVHAAADEARPGGSSPGTNPGAGARDAGGGIPGAGTIKPKTGTDDLTSRAASQPRDRGPGGTGAG